MQIKSIHITDKEYTDLVRSCGSVYNTPEWLSLYGPKCKVHGIYNNNVLVAAFNTYSFKKTILEFFIPPPFMPDCALIISDQANKNEVTDAVLAWLEKQASKKNYSGFTFNLSYKYSGLFSDRSIKNLAAVKKHTYVLDLSQSEEVQSLYAAKRRQQIRRALKDGLTTKRITDMKVVFDLVKKTFARQEKTIDERYIKKILFEYATEKNSFAFASLLNGKYSVVYFCIHYNNEAYYLLGGYDELIKHIGAGPLAMSASIEYAKKTGINIFDFEGSMEPSIEKYFKEFGGTKKLYTSFEGSSKLGKMAVKLKKLIKG